MQKNQNRMCKEKWENFDAWLFLRLHLQLPLLSGALIVQAKKWGVHFMFVFSRESHTPPPQLSPLLQLPLILALHIWMNAECRRRRRRIGCGLVHRFVVSLSLHPPNYPAWQWKSINLIWHLPRPTNQLPSPSTPPPKNLLPTFPSADSAHLPFACRWATIVILLSRLTKWHTLRFLMSRLCRIWEVVGFPSRMWVGYFMLKKIRDRFMLNM